MFFRLLKKKDSGKESGENSVDTDSFETVHNKRNFKRLEYMLFTGLGRFGFFMMNSGDFYAFGSNGHGQLALNRTIKKTNGPVLNPYFVPNSDKKIRDVSCGEEHALFVTESNKSYACGNNSSGELSIGDEKTEQINMAREVVFEDHAQISGIAEVACGINSSYFLSTALVVYAAGSNRTGQLGLGRERKNRYVAKRVRSLPEPIIHIRGGFGNVGFLSESGSLYLVGQNKNGMLGVGGYRPDLECFVNIKVPQKLNLDIKDAVLHNFVLMKESMVVVAGSQNDESRAKLYGFGMGFQEMANMKMKLMGMDEKEDQSIPKPYEMGKVSVKPCLLDGGIDTFIYSDESAKRVFKCQHEGSFKPYECFTSWTNGIQQVSFSLRNSYVVSQSYKHTDSINLVGDESSDFYADGYRTNRTDGKSLMVKRKNFKLKKYSSCERHVIVNFELPVENSYNFRLEYTKCELERDILIKFEDFELNLFGSMFKEKGGGDLSFEKKLLATEFDESTICEMFYGVNEEKLLKKTRNFLNLFLFCRNFPFLVEYEYLILKKLVCINFEDLLNLLMVSLELFEGENLKEGRFHSNFNICLFDALSGKHSRGEIPKELSKEKNLVFLELYKTIIPKKIETLERYQGLGLFPTFRELYTSWHLKQLFSSRETTGNLTIISSDEEKIMVHKEVVILESDFFFRVIKFGGTETREIDEGTLFIEKLHSTELKLLLEFVYLKELRLDWDLVKKEKQEDDQLIPLFINSLNILMEISPYEEKVLENILMKLALRISKGFIKRGTSPRAENNFFLLTVFPLVAHLFDKRVVSFEDRIRGKLLNEWSRTRPCSMKRLKVVIARQYKLIFSE